MPSPKAPPGKSAPKQTAKAPAKLPKLLAEVSEKYRKAGTLEAEFTQVTESSVMKQRKTTSGVLLIQRPDKVRWETLRPDKNLLVSDGRKFWFYTPPFDEGEPGQVIERKSTEVKSKLAHVLLSGSFGQAGDLKIRQESGQRFVLTPKPGTAGTVTEAIVEIEPRDKLIRKVILQHKDGNRAEITLSKIELGKKLDPEYFQFEAPPGTDRVQD